MAEHLDAVGHLKPVRDVRSEYAGVRARERAEAAARWRSTHVPARTSTTRTTPSREARRVRHPATVTPHGRSHFDAGRSRPGSTSSPPPTSATAPPSRSSGSTEIARVYRAYEEELGRARRARLRGADRTRHPAVQDPPQRPAPLAAPVPVHPGGRVPGCERRPDRAHRAPGPHAGPPGQRDGGGRRRPVHLPLPRRQLSRPSRSSTPGSAPAAHDRPAGARLARASASTRTSAPSATSSPPRTASSRATTPASSRTSTCGPTRTPASPSSSTCAPAPRTRPSPSWTPSSCWRGRGTGRSWNDVAILYRKHKHRDAIVARLRDEDIPYTVVGGLSLFEAPEIRDLEQGLRAIADPTDDPALVRDDDRGAVAPGRPGDPAGRSRRAVRPEAPRGGCHADGRAGRGDTRTGSPPASPPSSGPSCARCWGPSRSSTRSPGARARPPSWSGIWSGPASCWTSSRPARWRPSAPSSTSPASCASRPSGRPRTRPGAWRTSWPTSTPTRRPAVSCPPASSCPRTWTACAS